MKMLIVLTFAAMLAACGSEPSASTEPDTDQHGSYTIDPASGETTINIKSRDGSVYAQSAPGGAITLPDGYTLYPGAQVISTTRATTNDGTGSIVLISTSDRADAVAAFYRKQAQAAGVELEFDLKTSQGQMMAGQTGEGGSFSINITSGGDGTTAHLMVSRALPR